MRGENSGNLQNNAGYGMIMPCLLYTSFNEVNTIPGFTEHSRFPGMMRGAGVEFGPLVERLQMCIRDRDI